MRYMKNSQLYGLWMGSSGSGFQAAFMLTKGARAESFKLNIDWAFSTNSWDPSKGSITLYFLKTAALIASLSYGKKWRKLSSTTGPCWETGSRYFDVVEYKFHQSYFDRKLSREYKRLRKNFQQAKNSGFDYSVDLSIFWALDWLA